MSIGQSMENALKKRKRQLEKDLYLLTKSIVVFIYALDLEMKNPESHERGKRIAKLCNELEMVNDRIRHFTLGKKLTIRDQKVGEV